MRIAIYSTPLPAGKDQWKETDWFTYEVIKHLATAHAGDDFLWITSHVLFPPDFTTDNVSMHPLGKAAGNTLSSYIQHRYRFPALVKELNASMLLAFQPPPTAVPIPVCLVAQPPFPRNSKFSQRLQQAAALAVVSAYDRDKLSTLYRLPSQKIATVHWGIHEGYKPLGWEQREQVKGEYTDGKEYFIFLGAITPGNNILNLLKGFSILKKRLRSNMVLVLAGELQKNYPEFPELLQTYYFRNDVKWIQHISLEERFHLIGGAYGLICPFAPESFRPEILEAFACRVPAIVADNALAREIGEDAAIYCNAQNIENIGDVLCEIYKDENLRGRLIAVGDIQAGKYSWEKTAGKVWAAIQAAVQQK